MKKSRELRTPKAGPGEMDGGGERASVVRLQAFALEFIHNQSRSLALAWRVGEADGRDEEAPPRVLARLLGVGARCWEHCRRAHPELERALEGPKLQLRLAVDRRVEEHRRRRRNRHEARRSCEGRHGGE